MKILFVTDLCPIQDNEKGLPLTLLNFILDFKKLGHEVVLLRPNIIPNVLLRKRKILPEGVSEFKTIKCINKNFLTPFFKKEEFDFLKGENFDVILSHMPSGILAAKVISEVLNIPYHAAVHASDIEVLTNYKYFFLRNRLKEIYKGAKNVVARSYWLKDKIEKIIPSIKEKTFVVPSGIEEEAIISSYDLEKKMQDFFLPPLKIFSAGSLIKRKNFSSLIEALETKNDFKLKIAGTGKEIGKLYSLIRKHKLNDKVVLLGHISKEEIYSLMKEASVFVLPSIKETFGMVYLEALAKGCIVVCTKNSGMAGFIKDGINGFLTEPDSKSIKECILKITSMKNPETIMKNAVNTAIEMERIKMSKNYLNLIQNILF